MKKTLCVCALTLLTPVVACASPITYNISNLFSNFSVTGTVTTNGNTGALSSSDITGWDLILNEGLKTFELTTSNSREGVYGTTSITASTSGLFMNYAGNGGLLFQSPSIGAGTDFLCYQSNTFYCYNPNNTASEGININGVDGTADNYVLQSGNVQIGTTAVAAVTPEPGSLVLLGTGLAGFAGLARRRFSGQSVAG